VIDSVVLRRVAGWLSPALALVLGGCMLPPDDGYATPRPMPSVTQRAQQIDENAFWAIIEDVRARGQGDPDRMADALDYKLYDASDETIQTFQAQLVAASERLYTWRHGEAAEMICGGLDQDAFTDWRSWVISLGRATFESVVADPDSLADVHYLEGGCEMMFEPFGWTATTVWNERHPTSSGDFATLDPDAAPGGVRIYGTKAIRAALPRLAART